MKIAMFTDVFLEVPGGIGSSITAAKKSLESRGHEVIVFCPGWHPEPDQSIAVVPSLRHFRPNDAPWARRPSLVAAWILSEHPEIRDFDLFHAHYEGPVSLAAVRLARELGKPLVQTLHGREDQALSFNIPRPAQGLVATLLDRLHSRSLQKLGSATPAGATAPGKLRFDPRLAPKKSRAKMWRIVVSQGNSADLVVSPSQHFADKLQKMGLETPVKILPNGIEDDIVPLGPKPRSLSPGEPIKILWNSRLSKEKRFLALLEALKIAGEKGLRYELTAFGDGNDLKKAQKYVKKHRLNVNFAGTASRANILRHSTRSHLSVITSYDFDVHGLILVEATAVGTPLLICDPDMKASLIPGSFVLSRSPAPADLASSLLHLYRHPELISEMSLEMLRQRRSVFQSARIGELLKIYQSVLK